MRNLSVAGQKWLKSLHIYAACDVYLCRKTSVRVSRISIFLGFIAVDHDPPQTCYKRTDPIEIMPFEIGRLWRS
jgi:hypothetical protein